MSTKALKKELMAAVVMVIVAAIALSGSTYAWFVNNNRVTATGFTATARTDNAFLLISDTSSAAVDIQAQGKTSIQVTLGDADTTLYPAAMFGSAELKTSSLATPTNWYTGYGTDAASSGLKKDTLTTLGAFDGYVIHKQLWMTVATTSNLVYDLTPSVTITKADNNKNIDATKVVITSDTTGASFEYDSSNTTTISDVDLLGGAKLSSTAAIQIDVFIYIDGNESTIFTNNFNQLGQAKIDLAFSAKPDLNN